MSEARFLAIVGLTSMLAASTSVAQTVTIEETHAASVYWEWVDDDSGFTMAGAFGVVEKMESSPDDPAGSPTSPIHAHGWITTCTPGCATTYYRNQPVQDAVLTADPFDNVVNVDVCLTPNPSGPCSRFALTFLAPTGAEAYAPLPGCSSDSPIPPGFPIPYACGRLTVDGSAPSVAVQGPVIVGRWGHVVTGTFAGAPLPTRPLNGSMDVSAGAGRIRTVDATIP